MRAELSKVEAMLSKLMVDKAKLFDLDPSADLTAVCEQFNACAVDEV